MKLKGKLIMITLIPVLVLTIIAGVISYIMVEDKMADEVYAALKATAICTDSR